MCYGAGAKPLVIPMNANSALAFTRATVADQERST
jgi:hypothetical protein